MSRHRVPMLTASLHRYPDPARSPDPAVRALVSLLATLDVAPAPAPDFKAELRGRLVAAATAAGPLAPGGGVDDGAEDRTVDHGAEEDRPAAPVPVAAARDRNRMGWRRPVAVAVSSLAAVLLVLGALVWLSGSAVPGAPLYGVKRTAESLQLALTSGTDAKGRLELQFAQLRSDEVVKLISRPSALGAGPSADASIGPTTASLIRTTLASADADVLAATRLLTQAALRAHDAGPLKILAEWAPGQRRRLGEIADRLPAGALRERALQSAHVVEAAKQRVIQLTRQVRCDCGTTHGSDPYGPVPCRTCGSASSGAIASTSSATTAAPVPGSASSTVPAPGSTPGESTTSTPYPPGVPAPVESSSSTGGSAPGPGATDSTTDSTTEVPPTSSTPAVPSDSSSSSLTPTPSLSSTADPTSTDTPSDSSSAPPPSLPSLTEPTSSLPSSDLPPSCVPAGSSGLDGC